MIVYEELIPHFVTNSSLSMSKDLAVYSSSRIAI